MTETLLTCSLCRESYTARTERDDYDVRGSSFDAVIEEDWECPDCGGHPIDCNCGACPTEKQEGDSPIRCTECGSDRWDAMDDLCCIPGWDGREETHAAAYVAISGAGALAGWAGGSGKDGGMIIHRGFIVYCDFEGCEETEIIRIDKPDLLYVVHRLRDKGWSVGGGPHFQRITLCQNHRYRRNLNPAKTP